MRTIFWREKIKMTSQSITYRRYRIVSQITIPKIYPPLSLSTAIDGSVHHEALRRPTSSVHDATADAGQHQ